MKSDKEEDFIRSEGPKSDRSKGASSRFRRDSASNLLRKFGDIAHVASASGSRRLGEESTSFVPPKGILRDAILKVFGGIPPAVKQMAGQATTK